MFPENHQVWEGKETYRREEVITTSEWATGKESEREMGHLESTTSQKGQNSCK